MPRHIFSLSSLKKIMVLYYLPKIKNLNIIKTVLFIKIILIQQTIYKQEDKEWHSSMSPNPSIIIRKAQQTTTIKTFYNLQKQMI